MFYLTKERGVLRFWAFIFGLFFTLPLLVQSALAQTPIKVDLSRAYFSIFYGGPAQTEAQFNIELERLKNYRFEATEIGAKNASPIEAEVIGAPLQDPEKLLHHHLLKIKFKNLKPGTFYTLTIYEKERYGGEKKVNQREFRTLFHDEDPRAQSLNIVIASCMNDEQNYVEVAEKICSRVYEQNPDLIVLTGDLVYVDAFGFVEREKATSLDIWLRYFRSFENNLLFRSRYLVPMIASLDDHDVGTDNANRFTASLKEARRAFKAFFGSDQEEDPEGAYRIVSFNNQHFILLDNRSFRSLPDTAESKDRFGHLGEAQERWLIEQIKKRKGFFWIVSGDMWGSELVLENRKKGPPKRIIEGFSADHPEQYQAVMKALNELNVPYVLVSGDIHFSQIIEHSPHSTETRKSPFRTLEIVSSPLHSFIFRPKAGEPPFWKDLDRVVAVRDYNFIKVLSQWASGTGVDLKISSIGKDGQALFNYQTRIDRTKELVSKRRQLLVESKNIPSTNGKVKVAFLDADGTLRISPLGHLTAQTKEDVVILPGVSNKIATLIDQGYFIALVSNQMGIYADWISFGEINTVEEKFEIAEGAFQHTMELILKENPKARFHYYDFAEGLEGDHYRKPNIGMAQHLARVLAKEGLEIDWEKSLMVGDSDYTQEEITPQGKMGDALSSADRKFAQNLGILHIHPEQFFGWSDEIRKAVVGHDGKALAQAIRCKKELTLESPKSPNG